MLRRRSTIAVYRLEYKENLPATTRIKCSEQITEDSENLSRHIIGINTQHGKFF